MKIPVSRKNVPHYIWAEVCEGWRLVDKPELSVIEERVPPGASEKRHYHERARQFFYVLSGEAVLEVEGERLTLTAGCGVEVAAGLHHQFMNRSESEVVFLVTSVPSTKDDRISVE